ncbi:MAG: TIGR04283 family arsenosugar biosynthesis glycosyltransferase [Betaproteobacteria bacterium]|nr:TIGR04283 family arsenosugar biosynthesis glycosyltransferase [Betaproteobacteria bacterium]
MSLRIAAVVPVLDEAPRVAGALAPLLAEACEVMVADGGSGDGSPAQARAAGATVIDAPRGRALQMNAGAAALAPGWDAVIFVHADTRLPAGWAALVDEALRAGAAWGRFDVRLDSPRWLLRGVGAMMNWRSRLTGICTGDQAIFLSATAWRAVGGYPAIPLMEDIALSAALRRSAGRPAALRPPALTSARRWERHGALRTIVLMWSLRLRYFLGESPQRLHRRYYGPRP